MATKNFGFGIFAHVWSVTASLFLPGVGFTKTPTYSLKEIVESLFLEKKSGGRETGVFLVPQRRNLGRWRDLSRAVLDFGTHVDPTKAPKTF